MTTLTAHAGATPATILTGFLGSGKTTLLNRLLAQPALRDTAVLVNEFGEVGIDHLLVRRLDETTVLLNSGCICCTVRSDLVSALRALYTKRFREEVPSFARVMIETTGLADPAPIAHTFFSDLFVSSCFRLDAIVVTVDAVNAMSQIDRYPESVKQIAIADRLLITKTDLVSRETVDALGKQLRRLNPAAPIEEAVNGNVASEKLLDIGIFAKGAIRAEEWLRHQSYARHEHDHEHAEAVGHHHLAQITSFCAIYDHPLSWNAVTTALESIVAAHGQDLLRTKGILNVQGEREPVVMHGIQHLFHPPVRLPHWPSEDRRSRLVFITRDAAVDPIRRLLAAHLGRSTNVAFT